MDFEEIIDPGNVLRDLKAANQWAAIDELIDNLVITRKIRSEDREAIAIAVKNRERSASTGIGDGVAIPHASTELVQDVVAAVGRSRNGIDFNALGNEPVYVVFLFLVPKGQFQKHLHTLANIAKVLPTKEFRDYLGM
jgi:mannitol/fructose-specific phosphotransferase system IIA component (Ntr-type)